MRSRFEAADGWRGLCALLVALHHGTTEGRDGPLSGLGWLSEFLANSYMFVDFFFVLSGFVITHSVWGRMHAWRDCKQFMLRRIARIYPLYLAVLAVYVAFEFLKLLHTAPGGSGAAFSGGTAPSALLSDTFLLNAFGLHHQLTWNLQSWSIGAEFWTYVVFAFIALVAPGSLVKLLVGLTGFLVLLAFGHGDMNETFDLGFFRCLYGFFLGSLLYRGFLGLRERALSPRWLTLVELLTVVGGFAFVAKAEGRATLASPLVFAVVVLVFACERGAVSQLLKTLPLQRLGQWSYSIYLIHTFFLFKIAAASRMVEARLYGTQYASIQDYMHQSQYIPGWPILGGTLFLVAYLAVVVGVASLTERFIEQPGRRLFAHHAGRSQSVPLADTVAR